jgi:hypothetical protein
MDGGLSLRKLIFLKAGMPNSGEILIFELMISTLGLS